MAFPFGLLLPPPRPLTYPHSYDCFLAHIIFGTIPYRLIIVVLLFGQELCIHVIRDEQIPLTCLPVRGLGRCSAFVKERVVRESTPISCMTWDVKEPAALTEFEPDRVDLSLRYGTCSKSIALGANKNLSRYLSLLFIE